MFSSQFFDLGYHLCLYFLQTTRKCKLIFFFQEYIRQLTLFVVIRYGTVLNLLNKHFVKLPRVHQQFI